MTLLLTIATILSLLIPGLAAVHLVARRLAPEMKFAIAPAVTIVIFALAGVAGWIHPHSFVSISRWTVGGSTLAGFIVLLLSGGYRAMWRIDPVLPAAYGILVVVATQFCFLPITIPDRYDGGLRYMYYVQEDKLPVRIQALYHDLPNDNLVSYRFAQFMLRGVDFRLPREWDNAQRPAIAPGQSVTARTPVMALVGAHYINLFGPRIPVDGRYGKLGDLLTDDAYRPFFLAATCLNALLILPVYLIGRNLSDLTGARLAVLLLACNAGVITQAGFIWPKSLAGYFAILLAYCVLSGSLRFYTIGILAALSYYSHQCGMAVVVGCCIYYLLTSNRRPRAFGILAAAATLGLILVLPWHVWAARWIGDSGNLVSQNIYQGAEQGWTHICGVRAINILKTLIPHNVATAAVPTARMFFLNSFFTLPGMLGLVLVPVFGAALRDRSRALASLVIGLGSVLITAITFGQSMGGLAPFGPYLFVPIAMAFACTVLVSIPAPWRLALSLAAVSEQLVVLWYGCYWKHWQTSSPHVPSEVMHVVGLLALQGLALLLIALVSLRKPLPHNAPCNLTAGTEDRLSPVEL